MRIICIKLLVLYLPCLIYALKFHKSDLKLFDSSKSLINLHGKSTVQERFDEETQSFSLKYVIDRFEQPFQFLLRAGAVGLTTGLGVVLLKNSIYETQGLLYEGLADILPKPAFYWPIAIYPFIGSAVVSILTYCYGSSIWNGLDFIAKTIDVTDNNVPTDDSMYLDLNSNNNYNNTSTSAVTAATSLFLSPVSEWNETSQSSSSTTAIITSNSEDLNITSPESFNPIQSILRLASAVTTLGSGCSLGPEGPSVEIGAGWSRVFAGPDSSTNMREKHHLFLAGTAAGVAAGFGAPIAGIFFALECGNRCLARNTVKLDEDASDAPRTDIAAIVLAATLSNLVVQLLLQKKETLLIQGNSYAMISPFFELPVYLGLAIISGLVSVGFDKLKEFFIEFYKTNDIPNYIRPVLGGLACGLVAIFYPQTLFNGYISVGDLLSNSSAVTTASSFFLLLQILFLKLFLSSFSLVSGLVGGVFAPALFWGAASGAAYHYLAANMASVLQEQITIYAFDIAHLFHGLQDSWSTAITSIHTLGLSEAHASQYLNSESGLEFGLSMDESTTYLSSQLTSSTFSDEQLIRTIKQFFTISNSQAYATVGAAATLGAVFRAPLTSCMLMFELTQNHDIVLPVLFATGLGGFFAEIVRKKPKINDIS